MNIFHQQRFAPAAEKITGPLLDKVAVVGVLVRELLGAGVDVEGL